MAATLSRALVNSAVKAKPFRLRNGLQVTKLLLAIDVSLKGQSSSTLLTTAPLALPKGASWPRDRARIDRLAAKRSGRVLFAIADDQIVAAIGFTLKFRPIVAYVLAADAQLPARGLRNLLAAKECLHYIAEALGRPGEIYFDAAPQSVNFAQSALGFRKTGNAYNVRPSGTLLVQPPPP